MIHVALGAHAAVGELPPAVVPQARSGFADGPAPAASAVLPEGRAYDSSLGAVARSLPDAHSCLRVAYTTPRWAPSGARCRAAVDRADTTARR